jgi:hypothetical protein
VTILSGPNWCELFPTSVSLDDLIDPFKTNCKTFISALQTAGATVTISATYRPAERAFLMHYSAMIAASQIAPSAVPVMAGVNIQWDHGNLSASIVAAKQMTVGYGIVYPPALTSRHTQRLAVDMDIHYPGASITLADGTLIDGPITLHAAGAKFGVIKLLSDPPHWSSDGH